jgi:Cu(I)/Ag(I) efflux system membrane fusion protein
MKKNILYIIISLAVGLIGGYFLFGGSGNSEQIDEHNHSYESVNQLWTCSMHPQIMQPEPGDCPICGMDLIPAETSAEGLSANEIKMTENAMALANIQTNLAGNSVASESESGEISLSGKIATNEENNSVQASYFDGRIEKLYVNYEGQNVNRGQLLGTIYSPNLVAAQQELLTAKSLKESQPALYQAVRNKLKLWKLSESQIDKIEESGKVKENFPIYTTVSGTVAMIMVAEGDYVKQGQIIAKVSNFNSVWAEFDVYENQISKLKKGQKIKVIPNAYPNKELEVTISFINPVLNTKARTVTVRATLNNRNDLLKPGMFVTGKIKGVSETKNEALTIPASALLWTGERSVIYVKTNPNEPVFEMREVKIGNRNGDFYNIVSGLKSGEEIVTNGTFTVDAAAQLQGKKSMMNQNSAKSDEKMTPTTTMKMEFPKAFGNQFPKALTSYLAMKNAFVASDSEKASRLAKKVLKEFQALPIAGLGKMEKAHFNKILEMLTSISSTNELEKQREHFVILNENLVAIAMNIELSDSQFYVQKCPMANANNGAKWLSSEKEIKNPYYGEAMMTCGSVIGEL